MFNLKNAIDGFKLIIGGFVPHLVFFLVMIFVLRPQSMMTTNQEQLRHSVFTSSWFSIIWSGVSSDIGTCSCRTDSEASYHCGWCSQSSYHPAVPEVDLRWKRSPSPGDQAITRMVCVVLDRAGFLLQCNDWCSDLHLHSQLLPYGATNLGIFAGGDKWQS